MNLWNSACLALVMCVAAGSAADAASFECTKAKSSVEKVICSDAKLSAADGAMSAAYRAALAQLPPDGVSKLRVDQLRWLQWLQTACGVPGTADPGEMARRGQVLKPAALAQCMRDPYTTRTKLLKNSVVRIDGVIFLARSMYLLEPNAKDDTSGHSVFEGVGEYEASWPEAQSNDPQWTAWNAAVLATLQKGAAGDSALKRGEPGAATGTGWEAVALGVDSTGTMSMPKIRNGRVFTSLSLEGMGHGAAHPYEQYEKYTWLQKENRFLRVSDIFRPGTPWQDAVAAECWRQLTRSDNASALYDTIKGPQDKDVQKVITDVRNWNIAPAGLRISWPEYSVAPRVASQDDSVVPWKVVQAWLVEGFTP